MTKESDCKMFGTGWDEKNQDCITCKEEYGEEYVICADLTEENRQKEETLKTEEVAPLEPAEDAAIDEEITHVHSGKSSKLKKEKPVRSEFLHRVDVAAGFIDQCLIEGKTVKAIVDAWNSYIGHKKITCSRVIAHVSHLRAIHELNIVEEALPDKDIKYSIIKGTTNDQP